MNAKSSQVRRARLGFAFIPYVTVLVGYTLVSNVWIAFGLYHLAILLVLASHRELGQFRRLLRGFNGKGALSSALACLSAGGLIVWLWPVASLDGFDINIHLDSVGLAKPFWTVMIIYSFCINPWFEEAFWRGFIGSNSKHLAAVDFLFAGYHVLVMVAFLKWPWVCIGAILLVLGGWFWRQLARQYGGLAVPGLAHLAADCAIIFAVHYVRYAQ